MLAFAAARGVAVINAAPYAGGVLAKGAAEYHRYVYQEAGEAQLAPIRRIEARTYCHATEAEERVAAALLFAVPEGETSREELEGHFGNRLVRLTRRVEKRPGIRVVWERWSAAGIPAAIGQDVEARVDEDGVLHFRLDKQAAYQERLELAKDSDPIDVRLKLIAYPAKLAEVRRVAHSILAEAS